MVSSLNPTLVENQIIKFITEVNKKISKKDISIDGEFCPGAFIRSQILVNVIGRIARVLDIIIPPSCYIFHDKQLKKQLTIKEAVQKLLKESTNGK